MIAVRASRCSRSGPRRGFALFEAIAGGLLLSVGLAVLVSIATNSIARQRYGEEQVIAAMLLDNLLGEVLMEGPVNFPRLHDLDGRFDAPFERYTYLIDLEDQGNIDPFLVTATVFWDSAGFTRQESVQTLVSFRRVDSAEPREPGETILR